MPKTVLIPLMELAEPRQASFMELWVEPGQAGFDGLETLAAGPLQQAVAQTRAAIKPLSCPAVPARTRLMSANLRLSDGSGAGLGLALCPYLLDPAYPYSRYIINGGIQQDSRGAKVVSGSPLLQCLDAISALGYQAEPVLFLFPKTNFNEPALSRCGELASLNIAVRPVDSLDQAFAACTGYLEH